MKHLKCIRLILEIIYLSWISSDIDTKMFTKRSLYYFLTFILFETGMTSTINWF